MKFDFDIDSSMKFAEKKAADIIDYACVMIESKAIQNLNASYTSENVTGNLANSFFHEVNRKELKGIVVANTEYAHIQEEGGDILPVNAKALAIPIHPEAKKTAIPDGKSIRDIFPDLVLLPADSDRQHPLLVRMKSRKKGGYQVFEIMYVLVSKVHLEGKHYMKNALESEMPKVLERFRVN